MKIKTKKECNGREIISLVEFAKKSGMSIVNIRRLIYKHSPRVEGQYIRTDDGYYYFYADAVIKKGFTKPNSGC